MENGVDRPSRGDGGARAWAKDSLGAIALAEGALAQKIFLTDAVASRLTASKLKFSDRNAFNGHIVVEGGTDVSALAKKHREELLSGERSTLIASATELAQARTEMRRIASARLGGVVHALADRMTKTALSVSGPFPGESQGQRDYGKVGTTLSVPSASATKTQLPSTTAPPAA